MPQFFTYGWQHCEMLGFPEGEPIQAAYGSQFSRRGVCPLDQVYIVSVHRGRVHLLGKMLVRAVTFSADDFRRLVGLEPPPAAEYLIADESTPARLTAVPLELTQRLQFQQGNRLVGLKFRDQGRVDRQSLRSVRRLSPESAGALDELLSPLEVIPFPTNRSRFIQGR